MTTPKTRRKPAKLDEAALTRCLDLAAEYAMPEQATTLLRRLEDTEGARVTDKSGATVVKIAGLQASSTAGRHNAMMNWLNAARRRVMRGMA